MAMSKCRICGCMCDPGDLQNGVCDYCREEEAKEEFRSRKLDEMLHSDYEQIKFEFI